MAEYKQVWHDVTSVMSFEQKCASDQLCELRNSIQLLTVCFRTKSDSIQAHMHAHLYECLHVCAHTLTCCHHLTPVCQSGPFVLSMPTYSLFKLMFSSAHWVQYRLKLTFKRRIKSHLPFACIIRSSPYSTHFQDKG